MQFRVIGAVSIGLCMECVIRCDIVVCPFSFSPSKILATAVNFFPVHDPHVWHDCDRSHCGKGTNVSSYSVTQRHRIIAGNACARLIRFRPRKLCKALLLSWAFTSASVCTQPFLFPGEKGKERDRERDVSMVQTAVRSGVTGSRPVSVHAYSIYGYFLYSRSPARSSCFPVMGNHRDLVAHAAKDRET